MPFYEYTCAECGVTFDAMSRMAERDDPKDCPNCGTKDSHRELSKVMAGSRSSASLSGGGGSCGGGGGFS